MKKISEDITNWLQYSVIALTKGFITIEQSKNDFKSTFTKEDLKECFTDASLDADDLRATKEMLAYFFGENYEETLN
jgi:hypothetical protein